MDLSLDIQNYTCIAFVPSKSDGESFTDDEMRDYITTYLDAPTFEAFLALVKKWRTRMRETGAKHQVEVKVGDREMTFGEFIDWYAP